MYKLIALNEQIKTIVGNPILGIDQKPITPKSALITICELFQPERPGAGEALKIFDVGIRLSKAEDEIELSDPEMELIKKAVENSIVFVSVVIGRLKEYLDKAEQTKVDKK